MQKMKTMMPSTARSLPHPEESSDLLVYFVGGNDVGGDFRAYCSVSFILETLGSGIKLQIKD